MVSVTMGLGGHAVSADWGAGACPIFMLYNLVFVLFAAQQQPISALGLWPRGSLRGAGWALQAGRLPVRVLHLLGYRTGPCRQARGLGGCSWLFAVLSVYRTHRLQPPRRWPTQGRSPGLRAPACGNTGHCRLEASENSRVCLCPVASLGKSP